MPLCLLSLSDLARPHRTRNIGVVECVHTRISGRWRPTEPGYDGTTSGSVRVRCGLGGHRSRAPGTGFLCCLRVSAPRRLFFTASEDRLGGTGIAELGESSDRVQIQP